VSLRGLFCLVLRLKSRSQFQAVLDGVKLATSAHFAVHFLADGRLPFCTSVPPYVSGQSKAAGPDSRLWLGAMIPKRFAKRAVTRNAIKRLIYNVTQQIESDLPMGAYVVRLRSGFSKGQFPSATSDALKRAVRAELFTLMAKINLADVSNLVRDLPR
jgi:ribonuclease P protein component